MTGHAHGGRVMPLRFCAQVAGLMVAVLLASGCVSVVTPAPSRSAGPEASSPPAVVTSPPSSLTPTVSAADLRLVRGIDAALDDAIVGSLVSTPAGFALIGDSAIPGDRSRFTVSGSSDGRSWSRLDSDPAGVAFSSIAGGPLGWIAASDEPGIPDRRTVLWFSSDGTNWERLPDQAGLATARIASSAGNALSAGPGGFAAVGERTDAGTSVSAVWTSRDGRTWTEATALQDTNVGEVLVLPTGFLALFGCCDGSGSVQFSTNGNGWREVSGDPGSPFVMSAGGDVTTALLGSRLITLRAGPRGVVVSYRGNVDGLAGGGPIVWQQDAAADAAFTGAGVSAIAAGAGSVLVVGFDLSTLDPISWTGRDGRTWVRTALDSNTFGGGVPGLAAAAESASGPSFAAIGYRTNAAGEARSQVWSSDDGAVWSAADADILGLPPVAATGPCPTTVPTRVDDFLLLAAPLWPACFADQTLKVRGFIASCECGGTTSQQATPAWLIDPLGLSSFYLGPAIVQAATGRGGFGVMIDPAHPVVVPEVGQHVELTGHFADPASASCRIWPHDGAFGPVVPRAQTVALCRQAFVVSGIRSLP
jgi:hypothetical protein